MTWLDQDAIDAGVDFDWDRVPPFTTNLDEVPSNAEELRFDCEKPPLRRIRRFRNLRRVWLYGVNQSYLEEIVRFPKIHSLYVERVTATDLSILSKLPELRRLILTNGGKIQNLDWSGGLRDLESLAINSFNEVHHLDPLASLTNLSALRVGGSINTPMQVATLTPLSGLHNLRYLSIGSHISDGSLKPLHSLKGLKILAAAGGVADEELKSLHQALPKLRHEWFDMLERYGSSDALFKAFRRSCGLEDDDV